MTEAVCIPISLPLDLLIEAAEHACEINPENHPANWLSAKAVAELDRFELAVQTTNRWPKEGKTLTVGFLDNPTQACRRLILEAANEWSKYGNIKFVETTTDPMIRITRQGNNEYWSHVGPQLLRVPRNQPTMCLSNVTERFTDWFIVSHEFGHSAGLQHEQLRPAIISRINRQAAYDYFWQTSRWSKQMVDANVLTPLPNLDGSELTDEDSVMCYSLPAFIMIDGKAVRGGQKLSATDKTFFGILYPLPDAPQPPQPPPQTVVTLTLSGPLQAGSYTLVPKPASHDNTNG